MPYYYYGLRFSKTLFAMIWFHTACIRLSSASITTTVITTPRVIAIEDTTDTTAFGCGISSQLSNKNDSIYYDSISYFLRYRPSLCRNGIRIESTTRKASCNNFDSSGRASKFIVRNRNKNNGFTKDATKRTAFLYNNNNRHQSLSRRQQQLARFPWKYIRAPKQVLVMATIAIETGQSSSLNDDNNDNDERVNKNHMIILGVGDHEGDEELDDFDDDDDDDDDDDIGWTTANLFVDNNANGFQPDMDESNQRQQQQQKQHAHQEELSRPRLGQEQRQGTINKDSGKRKDTIINKYKNKNRTNTAMRDPQFLRKRTADLLRATAEILKTDNYNDENCMLVPASSTGINGDTTTVNISNNGGLTEDYCSENGNGSNGNNGSNIIGKAMKVDRKTFHFLMDAWAFSDEEDSAKQAIKLLECMEQFSSASSNIMTSSDGKQVTRINDDKSSFGDNLNCNSDGAVHEQGRQNQFSLQPDVRSFTKTMNAIARRADINAGVQAEMIFHRMQMMHRQSNGKFNRNCQPNSYTYTALIQAHAYSGAYARANEILQQIIERFEIDYGQQCNGGMKVTPAGAISSMTTAIVQPTAKAFHAVMYAYGKAGHADLAEQILNQMECLYEKYYGDSNNEEEDRFGSREMMKPNHFHYNTLISAWANSNAYNGNNNNYNNNYNVVSVNNGERAEKVLERMTKYAQPTTVSYNAVFDVYAKSDQAEKAEALLLTMLNKQEKQQPPQHQHQQLLQQQHGDSANNNQYRSTPRPNTRSFNSVMNAWAKSKHPNNALHAELLLDLMKKQYKEHGDTQLRPDVHSFCTVINAWARSTKQDKAERAFNLYREMDDLYLAGNKFVRPNVVAVNAVMNACAYTAPDNVHVSTRAVEIAHQVLRNYEEQHSKPTKTPLSNAECIDQITYGTFLKVIATQMPPTNTRDQVVNAIFKKCIKDGQVGNFVIQQLVTAASDSLYCELMGRPKGTFEAVDVRMEDLPESWWCNVAGAYNARAKAATTPSQLNTYNSQNGSSQK